MVILTRGNQLRAALNAPVVAVAYAVIALLVTMTGCLPPFIYADFFGVPVTFFLLLALTGAALILIVFAGLHAWRTYRVLYRRRRRAADWSVRRGLNAMAVVLALLALAATAWLGTYFLRTPCF